jgi:hypothetical protein
VGRLPTLDIGPSYFRILSNATLIFSMPQPNLISFCQVSRVDRFPHSEQTPLSAQMAAVEVEVAEEATTSFISRSIPQRIRFNMLE